MVGVGHVKFREAMNCTPNHINHTKYVCVSQQFKEGNGVKFCGNRSTGARNPNLGFG